MYIVMKRKKSYFFSLPDDCGAGLEVVVLLTVVLEGEDRVGVLLHLRLDIAGLGRVARLDEPPVRLKLHGR